MGLAASTTLTLRCVCRDGTSVGGGCTGGGTRGREDPSSSSISSRSAESLGVRRDDCDVAVGVLDVRIGNCSSFDVSTNVSSD